MLDEYKLELGSRWLDGDLGEQEEDLFQREMEQNPELRREIEAMDRLRRSLRRATLSDRPPELMDALVENFRQSPPPRRRLSLILPLLAAAALISISLLLIQEVGKRPLHPKKVEHQLFALKNPPSRPDDAPLGPLEELLEEDLEEPVLRIPHALIAQGPLPAPPPESEGLSILEIDGRPYPLEGVRPEPGAEILIDVMDETILSCRGGSEESCRELIGRKITGLADGKYRTKLLSGD